MLRVRAASFFTGFAVASGMAMYQVQKEVWSSHQTLSAQAQEYHSDLESRIARLEKSTGLGSKPKESE
ncbi:hypothetical protein MPTK1_1g12260 [Marchantia polymorpha subsp. ruderalis]|uniref:HIG1 domain-containing protein n=2 Tax=Marchantia polymorpha TaxID=3197 RepID=A0AAF6APB3_MARPO|nr:hypothetical protein MARPO_0014s0002 [Marchantia polymorpha]BBM98283.1 hypothetical protein Mp_1g12260 [Marchantia polymorpha subsp. ruderalis]PTQ45435.1 hypothetical protein MARPO_0014s0002 [Marchantia polymorpha]PTQ45436.1 hypothetical protein MARPO_0014s0002 [Marchantia polymorpha]BBM98284.1 hypothetical protein Mp_1g12260 [Marchantia polymorpha subsp. ruderalis]|eukprot:PTQ45434.1 hypothetical protein MARPO_0014s0002 [Marchantia polymorpha]